MNNEDGGGDGEGGDDNIDNSSNDPRRVSCEQEDHMLLLDGGNGNGNGNDDEIEFLGTIAALPAAKTKMTSASTKPTKQTKSTKPAATSQLPSSQPQPPLQLQPACNNKKTKNTLWLSSAYVQNLAEICETILRDLRWRVSGVGGGCGCGEEGAQQQKQQNTIGCGGRYCNGRREMI